MLCEVAGLLMDFSHWEPSTNEEQAERGQVAGRRSRSEGGTIAMQVAGIRAKITALDIMV